MRAERKDLNHAEVVKALEAVGCTVEVLPGGGGRPDIMVGASGQTLLMEIKSDGGKLNKLQQDWHRNWRGHVTVVWSPAEALRAVRDARGWSTQARDDA